MIGVGLEHLKKKLPQIETLKKEHWYKTGRDG
jgi:hypothetical protein